MIEKFNLKWNNFEQTSLKTFASLRHDKNLADVTLVANDQVRIPAHKIVLSSCSPFFSNLFLLMPNNNPFLYLSNVPSSFLTLMLDYIYTGETEVFQVDLEKFLKSAQVLEIEGLTFMEELLNEECDAKPDVVAEEAVTFDAKDSENSEEVTENDGIVNELKTEIKEEMPQDIHPFIEQANEATPKKKERKKYTPRSQHPKSIKMNDPKDSQEIDQKIKENVEVRGDGTFRCKVCNRINKHKVTMGHHIESHLEGVEFGCLMCDQKFRSRHLLSKHVCPVYTEQKENGKLKMNVQKNK